VLGTDGARTGDIFHLRTKFANIGWLTGEQIVRLAVGLLVMALVARHLGPEAFATYTYVFSIAAILIPIARYSCDGIVLRDIARHPEQARSIVTTSLAITTVLAIFAVIIGVLAFELLPGPEVLSPTLIALSLALVAVVPAEVFLAAAKASERMAWIAIPRAAVVITAGVATLLLVVGGAELPTFIAMRSAEAVFLALAAYLAFHWLYRRSARPRLSGHYAGQFLKAGLPLTLAGFAAMIYMRIDQVMLGAMAPSTELGHYGVAVRVAEVANFLPSVLQATLYPAMVRNHKLGKEHFQSFMQRTFDSFSLAAWPAMIGTAAAGLFLIVPAFGVDYAASIPLLLVLLVGSPFFFLYIALGSMLLTEGKVWTFAYISIASAIVNFSGNFFAIPNWGAQGAAGATVLTYFVSRRRGQIG